MTWRIYKHPAESDGNDVAPGEDAKQDEVESVAAPVDPAVQLQADLTRPNRK